jgi:hypothetical protein
MFDAKGKAKGSGYSCQGTGTYSLVPVTDEIRIEVRVREARSFLFGWGQWGSLPDADILEIERIIKAALAAKEPQP